MAGSPPVAPPSSLPMFFVSLSHITSVSVRISGSRGSSEAVVQLRQLLPGLVVLVLRVKGPGSLRLAPGQLLGHFVHLHLEAFLFGLWLWGRRRRRGFRGVRGGLGRGRRRGWGCNCTLFLLGRRPVRWSRPLVDHGFDVEEVLPARLGRFHEGPVTVHGQGLLPVDQDLGFGCLGLGLVVTRTPRVGGWNTRASQSLDLFQFLPKGLLLRLLPWSGR